jgi:hypothetical protein
MASKGLKFYIKLNLTIFLYFMVFWFFFLRSPAGKNIDYSNQIRFEEYNKQKLRQIELLRAVDPSLNKYYRDKANEYFNQGM